jgi:hypothetical protein
MAIAHELLALVWLLVILLPGMLVSAIEMCVSRKPIEATPTRRIAGMIAAVSPFTSTSSQMNYTTRQHQKEDMNK